MPEGPECHHIVDILRERIVGKKIIKVEIISGRYIRHGEPEGWNLLEEGDLFEEVGVKGKFIWFSLGNCYLFNTLGMTGQWTSTLDKHCRIGLTLFKNEESIIYFRDMRNFGTIKILSKNDNLVSDNLVSDNLLNKLSKIGYDILGDLVEQNEIVSLFRKRPNWTLPKFLMNQGYLSGVGNYLKCEVLHRCFLSPHIKISELSDNDLYQVYLSCREIAYTSYKNKGASFHTYRDPDKNKGKYSFQFECYGRKEVDGYPVIVEKTTDGRSTYWSPEYIEACMLSV